MHIQENELSQSKNVQISIEEYNMHVSRLNMFNTTKNNILTFSYTAVLALVGVIIASDTPVSPIICLIPYFLIIPFSARVSYYRLASAHINTFLKSFAPEKMVFANGTETVPERNTKAYPIIAWLINHEMLVLAIAVGAVYWYQCCSCYRIDSLKEILLILVPAPFIVVVLFISNSTHSYKKLCEGYSVKWKSYLIELNTKSEK